MISWREFVKLAGVQADYIKNYLSLRDLKSIYRLTAPELLIIGVRKPRSNLRFKPTAYDYIAGVGMVGMVFIWMLSDVFLKMLPT